jgi:hypothetical protein
VGVSKPLQPMALEWFILRTRTAPVRLGAVLPIEVGGSRTGAEGRACWIHPIRSAAFFPYLHELVYVSFLSGFFLAR